ncbi:Argonaute/Dicer protein, PAZ [Corchorus olitorius]|uniref:Argonaute/Dicer protein, PAZ n=1 Tax=Corchorus olitorius TaxID=93759 RepID=A0A1R3JDM1_9ROSI|nr:Argonaute/Dicer protein, PAZ [Corchorus olitorius]
MSPNAQSTAAADGRVSVSTYTVGDAYLFPQSFFQNDPANFVPIGGGVLGCRGFHSSFRTSQGGLSLNIDVSTTMIIQPGPVVDFLISNQNARDPFSLDWSKAKRVLKNLRIKVIPSNQEHKITGLSEQICREQMFVFLFHNSVFFL